MDKMIAKWLKANASPSTLYDLLGRPLLDPDVAGMLGLVRASNRALWPYQDHADAAVAKRAQKLLEELGRAEDTLGNSGKLRAYQRELLGKLYAEYAESSGSPAAEPEAAPLKRWLSSRGVHPEALESTLNGFRRLAGGTSAKPETTAGSPGTAGDQPTGSTVQPEVSDTYELAPEAPRIPAPEPPPIRRDPIPQKQQVGQTQRTATERPPWIVWAAAGGAAAVIMLLITVVAMSARKSGDAAVGDLARADSVVPAPKAAAVEDSSPPPAAPTDSGTNGKVLSEAAGNSSQPASAATEKAVENGAKPAPDPGSGMAGASSPGSAAQGTLRTGLGTLGMSGGGSAEPGLPPSAPPGPTPPLPGIPGPGPLPGSPPAVGVYGMRPPSPSPGSRLGAMIPGGSNRGITAPDPSPAPDPNTLQLAVDDVAKSPSAYADKTIAGTEYVFVVPHAEQVPGTDYGILPVQNKDSKTLSGGKLDKNDLNFLIDRNFARELNDCMKKHRVTWSLRYPYKCALTFIVKKLEVQGVSYWAAIVLSMDLLVHTDYAAILKGATGDAFRIIRSSSSEAMYTRGDSDDWIERLGGEKFMARLKSKYQEWLRRARTNIGKSAVDSTIRSGMGDLLRGKAANDAAINSQLDSMMRGR